MKRCRRTVFLALRGVLHITIVSKVLKPTPMTVAAAPLLAAGVNFLYFPNYIYMSYEYISRINCGSASSSYFFLSMCHTSRLFSFIVRL